MTAFQKPVYHQAKASYETFHLVKEGTKEKSLILKTRYKISCFIFNKMAFISKLCLFYVQIIVMFIL